MEAAHSPTSTNATTIGIVRSWGGRTAGAGTTGTINEIVNSISIIPDRIKQEIYVKHCSRIMDVSEEVLFNSLAQRTKNEIPVISKKRIAKVEKTPKNQKINILFELEKKIIEILLLYVLQ